MRHTLNASCAMIVTVLIVPAGIAAVAFGQAAEAPAATAQVPATQAQPAEAPQESPHELFVTVGKSLIVNSSAPIERVSVGYGDVAEATAVGPREILINGKAPGETSLIIWQQGGGKLFFDLTVRPSTTKIDERIDAVRRQLRKELPDQKLDVTFENDTVFLRGRVPDLGSGERALAIASTLGKTINLLYVDVPATDKQILLKVQFASVDRQFASKLGVNLLSTGNTIGRVTTGQFVPPAFTTIQTQGATTATSPITLSDALNIFMFRPDLNLAATIQALDNRNLFEILAEPNVLTSNGKQASFLAGGEFPYPILQGGGGGLGAVTIAFREFGVRIDFLPLITARGTIKLDVAPEVSALDFANGLVFQGFSIPGLTSRKMHTQIELEPGQAFAISGLLDRRTTHLLAKIPLLGDIPLLGKLFRSESLQKDNNELLVIVTPELVRPVPAGQKPPSLEFPEPPWGPDQMPRTPGISVTGPVPSPATQPVPMESLIERQKAEDSMKLQGVTGAAGSTTGLPYSSFQPPNQLPMPTMPAPAPAPAAPPK